MFTNKSIVKIKKNAHYLIQYINYLFCSILSFTPQRNDGNEYVLILRTDAIGDFILSLDAIYTLSLHFSNKKKVLVINAALYNWVKDFDFIDVIIPFNREKFILNFLYHYSFLKKIKKFNFVESFYLNYSREFLGDEIIKISNPKRKYGWNGNKSRISKFLFNIGNKFYTDLVFSNKTSLHELKRNNEFVSKVLKINEEKLKTFDISTKASHLNFDFLENKKYLVVAPGSRIKKKIWNLNKFSKVIQWLHEEFGLVTVLIGPKSEESLGREIQKKVENVSIYSLFGTLNFNQLLSLLKHSELLLTNDNAISHLGTKLNLKMVAILGGGQFGRFAPYGSENQKWVYDKMDCFNCDWICKYKEFKCIQNITVQLVKNVIEHTINLKILEGNN